MCVAYRSFWLLLIGSVIKPIVEAESSGCDLPLGVMRQSQVPQCSVEMLLLLRACAQRAVVQLIPVAASSCAGLSHGGEVAEMVGEEADGVVRSGLDHLQDGAA